MTRLLAALLTVFLALHSGGGVLAAFGGAWETTAMTENDPAAVVLHKAPGPASRPETESTRTGGLDRHCANSLFHGHDDGQCLDECGCFPEAVGFAFADPVGILTATTVRAATRGLVGGPYRPPNH